MVAVFAPCCCEQFLPFPSSPARRFKAVTEQQSAGGRKMLVAGRTYPLMRPDVCYWAIRTMGVIERSLAVV